MPQNRNAFLGTILVAIAVIALTIFFFTKHEDEINKTDQASSSNINPKRNDRTETSDTAPKEPKNTTATKEPARPEKQVSSEKRKIQNLEQAKLYIQETYADSKSDFEFEPDQSQVISNAFFKIYHFNQSYQGYKVFSASIKIFVSAETSELIRVQDTSQTIQHLPPENFNTAEVAAVELETRYQIKAFKMVITPGPVQLLAVNDDVHFVYIASVSVDHHMSKSEQLVFDASTSEILLRYPTSVK